MMYSTLLRALSMLSQPLRRLLMVLLVNCGEMVVVPARISSQHLLVLPRLWEKSFLNSMGQFNHTTTCHPNFRTPEFSLTFLRISVFLRHFFNFIYLFFFPFLFFHSKIVVVILMYERVKLHISNFYLRIRGWLYCKFSHYLDVLQVLS